MFQLLKNPQFDFMAKKNVLLTVSLGLVLASVGVLMVQGLNLGIEFTGGIQLQVQYDETPDIAAIRSTLTAAGMPRHSVTTLGGAEANEVYIRLGGVESSGDEVNDPTTQVVHALQAAGGSMTVRSQSFIWPAVGEELKRKAGLAILGSLLGMLVYIWIRFKHIRWGFAAVVALTHDAVITLGLFALLGKEMSLPVVAAFLTLVGYSVNDTVVVFDRIRENLRNQAGKSLTSVVNTSINQTLSRTIITSGLTLVAVLALLIYGGAALNPFSFVLTVGVVVGTYSSIYVASPFLVIWTGFIDRRKRRTAASGGPGRRVRKVRAS